LNRLLRLGASTLVLAAALVGPVPGTVDAADDVTLTLSAQPYAIEAGDRWTVSFDVAGDLGRAASATAPPTTATPTTVSPSSVPSSTPARPVVQVRVQAHRVVTDRAQLREVLDGDERPTVSRVTVPGALVGSARAATLDVSIPTTNDPDVSGALVLALPGLYPVTFDLLVDGEEVASHRTFVERLPIEATDGDPPLQVAYVARVDDPGPAPDAAASAGAVDALETAAAAATALGGVMSVQLPPSVVDAIDPAALPALRTSFRGVEVLAMPALALDPSSAVAAGQTDTFSRLLRDGEDILGQAFPDAPPQRSTWLVAEPLSAPAAAVLRDPLGYDLLVLDHELYDGLEGSIGGFHDPTLAFSIDLGAGAALPGIVIHRASRWLDASTLSAEEMSVTDGAIAIMAELRVTRSELGTDSRRAAVLETPPGDAADPAVLGILADYVATTPDMRLATVADLSATDVMQVPDRGPDVVRLPATAGMDLTERVDRIGLTRLNAAGAGSMLLDPAQAEAWDAELDQLVSTALDDATVDTRLAAVGDQARAVYDCIETPEPFTFTLTGRSQELRLNLTNTCDEDLRVVVHPTSSRLTFPTGDIAKTLAANDVTEVSIEVQSRSNGTSALGIELLTPVGSLRLPQTLVLTARVNALSGLGQVVTVGALLVLVSWWYGHFRRRRRARRALLGEVDNPVAVDLVSPDAAEVAVGSPDGRPPTDSVTDP
jgi:hypothetical protein